MIQQWQMALMIREDGFIVLDHDVDIPHFIIEIDDCVQQVLLGNDSIFESMPNKPRLPPSICIGKLGRRLIRCFRTDWELIRRSYPKHEFGSYIELFFGAVAKSGLTESDFKADGVDKLKAFLATLREDAEASSLKKNIAAQKRAVAGNEASLKSYLHNLFEDYARLLVVRLDLGFSKELRKSLGNRDINHEYVQASFARFLKHLDRKFPSLVGYARKLEYGPVKKYHFHLLLFFNGSKVREDITLGDMVGKYWEKVTDGNGKFYNCNLKKDEFREKGTLGVGMIHHSDKDMRKNLERVAMYLVKIDYYVRLCWPPKWKTFTHGLNRAANGTKLGRPRGFNRELQEKMDNLNNPIAIFKKSKKRNK